MCALTGTLLPGASRSPPPIHDVGAGFLGPGQAAQELLLGSRHIGRARASLGCWDTGTQSPGLRARRDGPQAGVPLLDPTAGAEALAPRMLSNCVFPLLREEETVVPDPPWRDAEALPRGPRILSSAS